MLERGEKNRKKKAETGKETNDTERRGILSHHTLILKPNT